MSDLTIRLHYIDAAGVITDGEHNFDLSDFAGFLPAVGDTILYPLVAQGLDRSEPANRELLTVVQRVFNPRDLSGYVALVCRSRPATEDDGEIIPAA